MIELRKNPRANVTWRAAVELDDGNAIPIKVVNISSGSFLFHSSVALEENKEYRLMMEVPGIDQSSPLRYQVPCKVVVMHIRLSGDFYQVGVRFTEISTLYQSLFDAWLSITTRFDQLA
jgi:PilZ domain